MKETKPVIIQKNKFHYTENKMGWHAVIKRTYLQFDYSLCRYIMTGSLKTLKTKHYAFFIYQKKAYETIYNHQINKQYFYQIQQNKNKIKCVNANNFEKFCAS